MSCFTVSLSAVDLVLCPFWARALPAADFELLLVRPSLSVLDAAEAAFEEVCFFGADFWERALPAAVFDVLPVEPLVSVFAALEAAFCPVLFLFATIVSYWGWAVSIFLNINLTPNPPTKELIIT